MRSKDPLYLFTLAGLVLVGIIVLVALARTVPPELWAVATVLVGGIVGVARQDGTNPVQNVSLPGAIGPNINGSSTTNSAPAESLGGPDVTG